MFANVLNQITGSIKRGPLHQYDLDFLQLIPQSKMADPIPSTVETTAIDLLVGFNYFVRIFVVINDVALWNIYATVKIWLYYYRKISWKWFG